MRFDYSYRRKRIGPWWCHITAWRDRQLGQHRPAHFAPGDPRMLVVDLTSDRRYILYVMARPWYECLERRRIAKTIYNDGTLEQLRERVHLIMESVGQVAAWR